MSTEAPPKALPSRASLAWVERGLAVGGVAIYGTVITRGDPFDWLWSCHVGTLLASTQLLIGPAREASAGALASPGWRDADLRRHAAGFTFLWLAFSSSLWLLDVLNGRAVDAWGLIAHLGGLGLGVVLVWRRGWPRAWVFWQVVLGLLALQQICRLVTTPKWNVNMAFGVQEGWEASFNGYALYVALIAGAGGLYLALVECALRRALLPAGAPQPAEPA